MMRSARIGGLVLAIALAIGACGGGGNKTASSGTSSSSTTGNGTGSSSGGGNASLEACKLSESDVGSVVGFTVKKQDGSGGSSCTFTALDTDSNHLGSSVSFNVASFGGGEAEIKAAAEGIANAFKATTEEVSGVGDKAFFIDAGIVGELVVFKGTTQVVVAVGGLDKDTSVRKDQTIALAKKLLA
jgi:hypothetical protein